MKFWGLEILNIKKCTNFDKCQNLVLRASTQKSLVSLGILVISNALQTQALSSQSTEFFRRSFSFPPRYMQPRRSFSSHEQPVAQSGFKLIISWCLRHRFKSRLVLVNQNLFWRWAQLHKSNLVSNSASRILTRFYRRTQTSRGQYRYNFVMSLVVEECLRKIGSFCKFWLSICIANCEFLVLNPSPPTPRSR